VPPERAVPQEPSKYARSGNGGDDDDGIIVRPGSYNVKKKGSELIVNSSRVLRKFWSGIVMFHNVFII
jgi:hypothetical protein